MRQVVKEGRKVGQIPGRHPPPQVLESTFGPDPAEQALKAFVLVNLPEKAQHERGKTEVLDLCKRNPPITEPEAIYQMQDALKCLSLKEEEGPKIWERAVTAKQNDKDLYTRWLNQAIADSDWLSAQKVWLHGQFYECKRRRLTWGHISTGHHGVAKIIP